MIALLLAGLLLGTELPPAGQSYSDNPYVRLAVALAPGSPAAADTVDLLLTFSPLDDIHINTDPGVEVRLDSSACQMIGGPFQAVDERTGFLDARSPVRVRLLPRPDPGGATRDIKATITYFYCSGTEGWCMKWRQQIVVPFSGTHPPQERQ